jgi:hypothetical protein
MIFSNNLAAGDTNGTNTKQNIVRQLKYIKVNDITVHRFKFINSS